MSYLDRYLLPFPGGYRRGGGPYLPTVDGTYITVGHPSTFTPPDGPLTVHVGGFLRSISLEIMTSGSWSGPEYAARRPRSSAARTRSRRQRAGSRRTRRYGLERRGPRPAPRLDPSIWDAPWGVLSSIELRDE